MRFCFPPVVFVFSLSVSHAVFAACSLFNPSTGQTVTCDGNAPNPTTTNIQAVNGSTDVIVNILSGSLVSVLRSTNPVAVSVYAGSQVSNSGAISLSGTGGSGSNRGAALLGVNNNNLVVNETNGSITTTQAFNDAMAANGVGNTLINHGVISTNGNSARGMVAAWEQSSGGQPNNTIINTGTVTTTGPSASAALILGQSGTINNSGSLLASGSSSSTVSMQGNGDQLINSGLIQSSGSGGTGVLSNTVSSTFTASIQNLAGGQIISQAGAAIRTVNGSTTIVNAGLLQGGGGESIHGGNGDVNLILQTGSTIVGTANGGSGNNQVTLQGSGTLTNPFVNFQTLSMQGDNWTWQSTGDFQNSFIQTGSSFTNFLYGKCNYLSWGAFIRCSRGSASNLAFSSDRDPHYSEQFRHN